MVKPSEAEKNLVQSTTSAMPAAAGGLIGPHSGGARRIYVGNLHLNMKEDQLRQVSAVTDQPGMQDVGTNAGDFDDDEGGGLALNARSRALLMQKSDRSGSAPSVAGPLGNPVVNSPGLALPTAPILGAAPSVSPLFSPLVQASVPALAGLPGAGLTVPPMFLLLISLVFLASVYC